MDKALKNRHLIPRSPNGLPVDNALAGVPAADLRKLLRWLRSRGLMRTNELPYWHLDSIRETGVDQYITDIATLERIRREFKPEAGRPGQGRRAIKRL